MTPRVAQIVIPVALAVVGAATLAAWLAVGPAVPIDRRVPVERQRVSRPANGASVQDGTLTRGPGEPSAIAGAWPQFRGPGRDNVATDSPPLLRDWSVPPPTAWALDVGEGYAGAAVRDGRVYLLDYDMAANADALRCLSLDDGREIWRQAYPVKVKRNHGMSRTVPAVANGFVVTLGPKCHVLCCDAATGEKKWLIDLVADYGATVPPWYAGQCPLIDRGRAVIAPGGPDVLMMAVDLATGEPVWTTPNPRRWAMSHASVMPMTLSDGRASYVYVAAGGVAGVDAATGELLWQTDAWQIRVATVPSALVIDGERLFLSGGYNAGSMMLRVQRQGDSYLAEPLWTLPAEQFGSAQQTPVYDRGHIFGVRPDGQLVCLDLDGRERWASGPTAKFGMGPYLIADGLILVLDDGGRLTAVEAAAAGYRPVGSADVLDGHDAWAPMALAGGRLILRDLTQLKCIDLRARR